MIAYRVEEAARRDGFATRVEDMARCKAEGLTRERSVLIVVSTYGNGEPPPDAIRFWEDIVRDQSLDLRGLKFSVLALGNSTYDHFCKCGKDFDEALERLGATRLFPRVDSDMDFTAPVDLWIDGVLGALTQEYLASAA
jgi:sulfite reductase (NADPH) flavoprotein alpha-component